MGWVEGEGWLSSLAPLRRDILEGDYRALYLAWLRVAELDCRDNNMPEPPVPPGLRELSPPLESFVEFLELDEYLLQAAAEASAPIQPSPAIPLEQAISRLSPEERDLFLIRLARGEPHLSLALRRRLQELTGHGDAVRTIAPQRTWGQLRATARRLQREAERRAAEAAEARRIARLQALAQREAETWQMVVGLIEEKKPASYDRAVALLIELRELAEYQGRKPDFEARVMGLQERYSNRPALRDRLRRAGLL